MIGGYLGKKRDQKIEEKFKGYSGITNEVTLGFS
jgi:hypothetical protein